MTVKVKNMLTKKVRVWVTSHDLFPGSQQAWYPILSGKEETWSRSRENKVTIEYAGKEYSVLTSGYDTFVLTKYGVRKGSKNGPIVCRFAAGGGATTLKAKKVWRLVYVASGNLEDDTHKTTLTRHSTSKLSSGIQSSIKSSLKSGGGPIGCEASIEAELSATSSKTLTEKQSKSTSQTFSWGLGDTGYLYARETYVGIDRKNGAGREFKFEDDIYQTWDTKQTGPGFDNSYDI